MQKNTCKNVKSSTGLSVSSKALASTSLVSLLAASTSQGIIQVFTPTGNAKVDSTNTSYDWDIDGAGSMAQIKYTSNNLDGNTGIQFLVPGGLTAPYGFGPIATGFTMPIDPKIKALGTSFFVTNSTNLTNTDYAFLDLNFLFRSFISNQTFADVDGFTSGSPTLIGFGFSPDNMSSDVFYGWAEIVVTTGANPSVELLQWAYQDDGSGIQVGAVPEPASVASGLGALALGAAGLRRWRRNKALNSA
ncbi:hypothetical protein [Rubellicoccus peritrichatus]|uniref:PEP-CTERM protein-sorting domain-containing protein n=1 Tax=Rubellicoccus peritrichatus TaxID=3080537 RepID=A0AAQ3LF68_9BACT|nr:hypothetical protein [Puniceicoccus sp. CR14]WOO42790.1 hypothetical protein RZN69_06775 [Puniceicoccus sp. CR14]